MTAKRKKQILLMVTALGLFAAASAGAASPEYRIHVNGLACPFCAYGIEKKLGEIKGVEKVETDVAAGSVTVTMADGNALDESAAAQAVKEAGFGLGGFEEIKPSTKTK